MSGQGEMQMGSGGQGITKRVQRRTMSSRSITESQDKRGVLDMKDMAWPLLEKTVIQTQ